MVLYDQLRISDDGQLLFVDAHVNKASYFDNVYLKRITICTEDQVSETNPQAYGNDFIYQADISTVESQSVHPVFDKVQMLQGERVLERMNDFCGLSFDFTPAQDAQDNIVHIALAGKFRYLDTGYTPKLVVANNVFDPDTHNLGNENILYVIDGEKVYEKWHDTWRFKGHGSIGANTEVCLYLFSQTSNGYYEKIAMDSATEDINFLYFFWNVFSVVPVTSHKEVHLVLDKADFDDAYNNILFDEATGEPYKDGSGEWARKHAGPVATKSFDKSDLSHNMFFVYIECDGTPAANTPCRLDEMTTLGVTFDYGIFFNQAMNYTRELADDCNIPSNFLDFILNFDALKLAVETEHFIPAITYWKRLTQWDTPWSKSITKPCGCHG